ncbi:hypothetical protein T484DRAFT_1829051 [Baffinella frigidus]|nr:hypothetical protein T484DRAFT_1829051 [Cryptophyta sp. CCMP2293]
MQVKAGECAWTAVKVKAGECAWAAVSVWGFEDAPVSWGRAEHSVGTQNPEP